MENKKRELPIVFRFKNTSNRKTFGNRFIEELHNLHVEITNEKENIQIVITIDKAPSHNGIEWKYNCLTKNILKTILNLQFELEILNEEIIQYIVDELIEKAEKILTQEDFNAIKELHKKEE